jgi:hypothetical protein
MLIKRFYKKGMPLINHMLIMYFNEIEYFLNHPDKEISIGLSIDIDYAIAFKHADVFFTNDEKQGANMKSISKMIGKSIQIIGHDDILKFK